MNTKAKCPVCKTLIMVTVKEDAVRFKDHGTFILGSKKPYRPCKGSGRRVV